MHTQFELEREYITSSRIQDISHVLVKIHDMTTIMVAMRDSLLVLESSNRHKIHEYLKGTSPQSIAFLEIQTVHTVGHLAMAYGKLMMVARLGIILEKTVSQVLM